ncbi:MAG TPA: ammonia-forming cytochrome c nitrite reductase subunit c552, partial [Anaerolineae bacterium]|nr:ammonia-forming cytochrome c nitrite reductase subunit c552 [Anaerolineae bacterium]
MAAVQTVIASTPGSRNPVPYRWRRTVVTLFAGYGFGKDHDEERGHLNSLIDVRTTKRVNEA